MSSSDRDPALASRRRGALSCLEGKTGYNEGSTPEMRRSEDAARRSDQANLLLARGRHAHWPGSEIALALMRATASLFVRSRSRSPLPTDRASCRASVGLGACWLSKPGRAMAGFDVIQAYRRVGSRRAS